VEGVGEVDRVDEAVELGFPAMAEFLREEVLATLPPGAARFLINVSVLRRLSAPACDAVLEAEGSASVLERLARAGLLVATGRSVSSSEPKERSWSSHTAPGPHPRADADDSLTDRIPTHRPPEYRFRPVLQELLQTELLRCRPDLVPALHRRASAWFESQGDPDGAIAHALAAGHVGPAADLVWSRVRPHPGPAEVTVLGLRLARFTAEQVARHAPLALSAAWHAVDSGRPAEPWLALADTTRNEDSLPGGPSSVTVAVALVRAVDPTGAVGDTRDTDGGCSDVVASMAAAARAVLTAEAPASPWWALASFIAGVAAHLTGDRDTARRALNEGAEHAAAHGSHGVGLRCRAQLTLMRLDDLARAPRGGPAAAVTSGNVAVGAVCPPVDEFPLDDTRLVVDDASQAPVHPSVGWTAVSVEAIRALALGHAGRPEAARAAVDVATALGAAAERGSWAPTARGWVAGQAWVTLARTRLLLHDPAAALSLIARADVALASVSGAAALSATLESTRRAAEALHRDGVPGAPGLTGAELRVLRFLPTHLSYQEIADRLFVSRNTVKSQAIAAYRKLGVRSRGAAVAAATDRGLLGG
ncbi:MAG: LuxR C-terminal-related transcriptional regulator, partial [Frankia sp.]